MERTLRVGVLIMVGLFLLLTGFLHHRYLATAQENNAQYVDVIKEPTLQAKVTLVVKREPLDSVIERLQNSTNVQLKISPRVRAGELKITAYVNKAPLGQVLASIAELYGFKWMKQIDGYLLVESGETELESILRRFGDISLVYYSTFNKRKKLLLSIYKQLTEKQRRLMHSKQGLPLSELPDAVVKMLRKWVEFSTVRRLLRNLQLARVNFLKRAYLDISNPKGKLYRAPRVRLMVDSKHVITIPWRIKVQATVQK